MNAQAAIGSEAHEQDTVQPWLLYQHQRWVDFFGREHEIETMPLPHVEQALSFCRERADRLWQLNLCSAIFNAIGAHLGQGGDEMAASALLAEAEGQEPSEWLERTPLLEALKRRQATLGG